MASATPCMCSQACRAGLRLADVAPRLARARDQFVEARRLGVIERRVLRDQVLAAEWRVAHRDLHLVRSMSLGRRASYLDQRQRKLDAARRELGALEARLAAAEAGA